jgi:hypothetical protein
MIEWVGIEVIAEHQIRGKNSGRSYSNVKRHGVVDLSAAAAVVWQEFAPEYREFHRFGPRQRLRGSDKGMKSVAYGSIPYAS